MSYAVCNVHWGYKKDPNSMFDNFATIELNYYGDLTVSKVKRQLRSLGFAIKPIKHIGIERLC